MRLNPSDPMTGEKVGSLIQHSRFNNQDSTIKQSFNQYWDPGRQSGRV
jgi:hypothetical protein